MKVDTSNINSYHFITQSTKWLNFFAAKAVFNQCTCSLTKIFASGTFSTEVNNEPAGITKDLPLWFI